MALTLNRRLFWSLFDAGLLLLGSMLIISGYVERFSKGLIYQDAGQVPEAQAALLLGAGIKKDGNLSSYALGRADAAMDLYRKRKVKKILVSGDHGRKGYDEVNTIRDYLLAHGLPREDIFMDHAGFDTYSSLYRARDVFKAKSLVVVSQEFHLPRALYIANRLGVPATAISADSYCKKGHSKLNDLRELPARTKAFVEAGILKLPPRFLGEEIPLDGDGRGTEDRR